jgi:hypothetical protein
VSAIGRARNRHPGVQDGIELHNDRQVTRRATSKEPSGNQPQWKYPSIAPNVKRGCEKAASRVMGTGSRKGLAEKRVMTAERRSPRFVDRERRNTVTMQRVVSQWERI